MARARVRDDDVSDRERENFLNLRCLVALAACVDRQQKSGSQVVPALGPKVRALGVHHVCVLLQV